ncbi:MAG: hypothetical protein J2P27_00600 [Actinobacteria bacterium]|nr:hypothetical protein [Actinomycetota bacterium]
MVEDCEHGRHEYRPGLRLRGTRFISDTEIELDFEGLDTVDRTFRAQRDEHGGIPVFTFDDDFCHLYRGIPCLTMGEELNTLVSRLFAARRDQLPADSEWHRAMEDCQAQVAARWNATHDSEG